MILCNDFSIGQKSKLGISSFGVSVTTMEEVFIKVGEGTDETFQSRLLYIVCTYVYTVHFIIRNYSISENPNFRKTMNCSLGVFFKNGVSEI